MREFSIWMTGHDLGKNRPGLGPNSWGYIRILVPYQGLFFDEGVRHDLLYSWGGNEEDKIFADKQFYLGCINKSKTTLQFLFTSVYYQGVKIQGYRFFNYH